jgi:hypothetical protein
MVSQPPFSLVSPTPYVSTCISYAAGNLYSRAWGAFFLFVCKRDFVILGRRGSDEEPRAYSSVY